MKLLTYVPLIVLAIAAIAKFNYIDEAYVMSNFDELSSFEKELNSEIRVMMDEMTLREKIAQMIIANAIPENVKDGSADFKKLRRLCEETKVGGFIFFKGSSSDYTWLSNKLQSFSETPLLLSADFERGTKMRVTDGALFPNNMALGATDNPELSYKMGLEVARETRLLGIHQNYAPVCDVNNNPANPIINVRSYGEDPALVSKMSAGLIKGLQEGKVIATAKHFPGHGDTDVDSHNDLPLLNFTMERLEDIELAPFRNSVMNNVMSVMIAHLSLPVLEPQPNVPSSLSPSIVQGLLIDRMGFEGLVVTDALNMKGITKYFSTSEVAVMCVNAGIDLILMPLDENTTLNAIEAAVLNGSISRERIDRSVEKILKAKQWLGLFNSTQVKESDVQTSVNTTGAYELAQLIADESITLIKDELKLLPLKDLGYTKTAIVSISEGGDQDNTAYLVSELSAHFGNFVYYSTGPSGEDANLKNSLPGLSEFDRIVIAIFAKVRFGTGKISVSDHNVDLINSILRINGNLVVISFGNPYLLKEFPAVPSYICAYGDSDVSINAALKSITGKIPFKGKLPVTINDKYPFGTGLRK